MLLDDDCTSFMESSEDIDCIYYDFSKALDRVSHSRLLQKVSDSGINGNIFD